MTIQQISEYWLEKANLPTNWADRMSEEDFCHTFLLQTDRLVLDYQAKIACNENPIINALRYRNLQEARCACIDRLNEG